MHPYSWVHFLVACNTTLHPALSVRRSIHPSVHPSVRPSVHWSVGPAHFTFLAFMGFLAIPLLPKCSTDHKYGPCLPARDWDSHVSRLVLLKVYSPFQSRATRLYTPLCRSVGPLVCRSHGPSVGLSVRWSVTLYFFGVYGVFGYTAPAQMLH